jgi:hypothetical protein
LAFLNLYRTPHPWLTASEWIYANVRLGGFITADWWDDPLPLDNERQRRESSYLTPELDPFAEPDTLGKIENLVSSIAQAEYLILSSRRAWAVIPRLDTRYRFTSALYRALMSEELGFVLDAHFERYPHLGSVTLYGNPFTAESLPIPNRVLPDYGVNLGWLDESFSVYDHPLVLVFSNIEHL